MQAPPGQYFLFYFLAFLLLRFSSHQLVLFCCQEILNISVLSLFLHFFFLISSLLICRS